MHELMKRLKEPISQMPEADDDKLWMRIVEDREFAVSEINRLVRSRNKWGKKYNHLLALIGRKASSDKTRFSMKIDDGPVFSFNARHSVYSLAVMEAFGALGLPYPCTVTIWLPNLLPSYGPYHYRIGDFVDAHGNVYGAPSIMTINKNPPLSERASQGLR